MIAWGVKVPRAIRRQKALPQVNPANVLAPSKPHVDNYLGDFDARVYHRSHRRCPGGACRSSQPGPSRRCDGGPNEFGPTTSSLVGANSFARWIRFSHGGPNQFGPTTSSLV